MEIGKDGRMKAVAKTFDLHELAKAARRRTASLVASLAKMKRIKPSAARYALVMLLAGTAYAQEDFVVEPTDSGIGALFGIDLLGEAKWEALKDASWYRKPDTALRAYVIGPAVRNPAKTLAGIGAAIVAVRAAEGKLDEDLKGLWEELGLRDGKSEPAPKPTAPEPVEGFGVATFGDDSPVYIETYSGNVSVETHGNNSPIIIKEPPQVVEVY